MKSIFAHFIKPSKEDVEGVWKASSSIFVLDTNVLLNLYRYSKSTSDEFIEALESIKDKIWIPHQVGLEYFKNRPDVIYEQKEKYNKFLSDIDKLVTDIQSTNSNPFFSKELTEKIISVKDDVHDEAEKIQSTYDKQLGDDHIKEKILSIFDGKVGKEYAQNRLNEIYQEGENRYKEKVPPGFCDEKKPAPRKYGDLILWNQIMDFSVETKGNIIFVLDDRKEDWWWLHKGKILSTNPDLANEFEEKTSNKILFYRPFVFLEHFNEYRNQKVAPEAIEEVKNYVVDSPLINFSHHFELKVKGTSTDALDFSAFVSESGYQITLSSKDDIHIFQIVLPDIPDLERRFHSRYIGILGNYGLELIDFKQR